MLKRIWQILGPVVCSLLIVLVIFTCVPTTPRVHDFQSEKKDAVSLSKTSFKSKYKKIRALTDSQHHFVPFFGSSEWLRFDKMHPSVLSEKYQRCYTPYLLGQRGSASLTHYFGIQQINQELKNKKVIYVISPQWFTAKGTSPSAFQEYFSSGQAIDFLNNQKGTAIDRYAARRFLEMYSDSAFKNMMEKVAVGKPLTVSEKKDLSVRYMIFQNEDALFSHIPMLNNYNRKIKPLAASLPDDFSYSKLEKIATRDGKLQSSNNDFDIDNTFFDTRIKTRLKKLKNSQIRFNYLKSPEYNDLQLVLNQFAKDNVNVLFVIPPVNSKWAKYTGLNTSMYQKTVTKIKYQLESQGFTNIADLSQDGSKAFFMQDTIHLGWAGWLAMDKVVNPFLSQKQPKPNYNLNDQFLTEKWAKYTGVVQSFN